MANNTRYSVYMNMGITSERLLSWIWQHQHLKPGLATTTGEKLTVIFPGRRNGLGGPDFRRAILDTRCGQIRGDIELHMHSSLWWEHGHQRNPAYNGVVLHVVMWHDSPTPIHLHNGYCVPTIALAPYILEMEQGWHPSARQSCCKPGWTTNMSELGQFLESLGKKRFLTKVAYYRGKLKAEDAAQVLYEGIMIALGYSRNQEAFMELSLRLPLKEAEVMMRRHGWQAIYNLLLEMGGLIAYPITPHRDGEDRLSSDKIHWQQQGVRPVNQPVRRLLAISHLLERFSTEGWLQGLMSAVKQASQSGGQRKLELALLVPASDKQEPLPKTSLQPALLGKERAGEIAVNILLPFAFAYGLESQAMELYKSYAPLSENEITREMAELLGINKKQVNSACCQQGLIHLFKQFCAERRCEICPLVKRYDT